MRLRAPVLGWLTAGCVSLLSIPSATAESQSVAMARELYSAGQYFKAARMAFSETASPQSPEGAEAHAWVTLSLLKARMPHAASYFFIRTLQSGQKSAIRLVLKETEELVLRVGADLLRPYLIRHTSYEDYTPVQRAAYLFSLSKEALLLGDYSRAAGYVNAISPESALYPFGIQVRATAQAVSGKSEAALADFRLCARQADDLTLDGEDLQARCQAGVARTLYQMERFDEADRAYDRIPKESWVWPEILFEQAWNSFARAEYNRTLGKLVTYKSPALAFVENSEIDVLRAQTFLALCLYGDANQVINDFHARYAPGGEEVKRLLETKANQPLAFWDFGKMALGAPLDTSSGAFRMANRFVRGPYFQGLVRGERDVASERVAAQRFAQLSGGLTLPGERSGGFPVFLGQVLSWRENAIRQQGGVFVLNSLLDHHSVLIADVEKMAFIKLEMLRRAKDKLIGKNEVGVERGRGNRKPKRRDDQYFWTFNGEFWNDELGDYVFALESECGVGTQK